MPTKPLQFLTDTTLEQRLIVAVSSVQGVLFYLLDRALEAKRWPSGHPVPLYLLSSLLLAVPLFFILVLGANIWRRVLACLGVYALVVSGVAAYAGYLALPVDYVDNSNMIPAYVISMGIVTFKALMYAQQYVRREPVRYPALLKNSWRLFLLGSLSMGFVGLFNLVIFLWGLLFNLIGVTIFSTVFQKHWFLFPASTTAFGFAVILFSNLDYIIENLASLMKTMLRFLLPLLAVIAVLFLTFLPFTGLQPIWDAKLGSATLLWLMALLLFFVNAVYQSAEELPYSLLLHRLIALAVACLPIYGILALHGLFTRIAQYGLTVDRLWGLIAALLLLGFAAGYLWSVAFKRDQWLAGLHKINTGMGLVVLAVLLLINTSLLNLQQLSANSQMARIEQGMAPTALDIRYFHRSLGRAGYLALAELKQRHATSDPAFVASIDALYIKPAFEPVPIPRTLTELRTRLVVWPAQREVPDQVLTPLLANAQQLSAGFRQAYVVFSDLDGDGQDEIVTWIQRGDFYAPGAFWTHENGAWKTAKFVFLSSAKPQALEDALKNGEITVQTPHWRNLRIGPMLIVPGEQAPLPTTR